MPDDLKIIYWPDPTLKVVSQPVTTFDGSLAAMVERMYGLMRDAKGVGLAAPQVGRNVRLFVMNHDAEPGHDRVYINPVLSDGDGEEVAEEGCLSLPKIYTDVSRFKTIKMTARDVNGTPIEQTETGFIARVWQHEVDHLNGILLTDRMGPVSKMTNRRLMRDLQEKYDAARPKHKKKYRL